LLRERKEDVRTDGAGYNAVNVAVCQAVWFGRILVDFEQVANILMKVLTRSKLNNIIQLLELEIFESRGSVEN
jgi:hypothetical protein